MTHFDGSWAEQASSLQVLLLLWLSPNLTQPHCDPTVLQWSKKNSQFEAVEKEWEFERQTGFAFLHCSSSSPANLLQKGSEILAVCLCKPKPGLSYHSNPKVLSHTKNHHTTVQIENVPMQKCENMQISVMLGGRVVNHPIWLGFTGVWWQLQETLNTHCQSNFNIAIF